MGAGTNLVSFSAAVERSKLPNDVGRKAEYHVLESIGAMVAGVRVDSILFSTLNTIFVTARAGLSGCARVPVSSINNYRTFLISPLAAAILDPSDRAGRVIRGAWRQPFTQVRSPSHGR